MTRIKVLGMVLGAVFAIAALTAASASAAPAYFECAKAAKVGKTFTGKYSDKLCTTKVETGGKYELQPGIGKGKASKTKGGAAELEVVVPPGVSEEFPGGAEIKIQCATNKGVSTSSLPNKVSKAVTTFSKCKVLGAPCQSGAKKETIVTDSLSGELVDIEAGEGVGTELGAEAGPASPTATFTCTEVATTNVLGSLIGINSGNINKISKESTLSFVTGHGLGAVEYAPGHTYEPLVNVPTHKTGGPNGEHFLASEISKEEKVLGTLPSGQNQVVAVKGEALEIQP